LPDGLTPRASSGFILGRGTLIEVAESQLLVPTSVRANNKPC